jgi:hypothetical protein
LSSTTDASAPNPPTANRASDGGQVLVIFALGLLAIVLVAALAFDTGAVLLERTTQRNAADAAALAGARFLPGDTVRARAAAEAIATANGFTHGVGSTVVDIRFTNGNRYIEVQIGTTRESIFAGVIGLTGWDVATRAVATNQQGVRGPFALLALEEEACGALEIEGRGELISNGDIQVNSSCEPDAFHLAGQGEVITAPHVACNVVGEYQASGASSNNCPVTEGTASVPDPYLGLSPPPIPMSDDDPPVIVYPTPPPTEESATGMAIPDGCPGSAAPATHDAPATCHFPGSYSGSTWRIYPGYYPGGINLEAGTFYLEPGIYWIGGGGFRLAGGSASVTSVAENGTTLDVGIMIYNSTNPNMAAGQVILQGGDAGVNLWPLSMGTAWDGFVVFQDRSVTLDLEIVGASSSMDVRGVIYAPAARVLVQANGGMVTTDSIIANTFRMAGNAGNLTVAFGDDFLPPLTAAGLVE